ncbi:hypothetical protein GCM10023185_39120 [Hymenobacter saemangeumensis]|uniref:DUF1905 domain-containing protein n=2 Tax=Hymenobacter saemangeumensis TaxID=1084522 RepID=A0ABP8IR75_9BACT
MPTQIIVVPPEVVEGLGGKAAKRVIARLNGHPERLGLLPLNGGGRYLMLRKDLCRALGITFGQELSITLSPDPNPDHIDLPAELQEALTAWPEAEAAFQRINNAGKRAMVRYLEEAKTAETRARRTVQMVERLARGGHPFRAV